MQFVYFPISAQQILSPPRKMTGPRGPVVEIGPDKTALQGAWL